MTVIKRAQFVHILNLHVIKDWWWDFPISFKWTCIVYQEFKTKELIIHTQKIEPSLHCSLNLHSISNMSSLNQSRFQTAEKNWTWCKSPVKSDLSSAAVNHFWIHRVLHQHLLMVIKCTGCLELEITVIEKKIKR